MYGSSADPHWVFGELDASRTTIALDRLGSSRFDKYDLPKSAATDWTVLGTIGSISKELSLSRDSGASSQSSNRVLAGIPSWYSQPKVAHHNRLEIGIERFDSSPNCKTYVHAWSILFFRFSYFLERFQILKRIQREKMMIIIWKSPKISMIICLLGEIEIADATIFASALLGVSTGGGGSSSESGLLIADFRWLEIAWAQVEFLFIGSKHSADSKEKQSRKVNNSHLFAVVICCEIRRLYSL